MFRQCLRKTAGSAAARRMYSSRSGQQARFARPSVLIGLAAPIIGYGLLSMQSSPIKAEGAIPHIKAEDVKSPEPTPLTTEDLKEKPAGEKPVEEQKPAEEEQEAKGAFDPETGEINWDCPCLGGMADGPCGEEFKAAFSCFVYSTEEPKGIECIEKFKGMQDCFRQYPEVYAEHLREDDPLESANEETKANVASEVAPVETPESPAVPGTPETPVVPTTTEEEPKKDL
ncbi:hypothetical protein TRVA0_010S02058 [Trichomonascus vanleenenianus]|uniref:Mia40p n=1 Tax=Trichomonascus vanleenenianus TaxID=2268995 RepID=UPI003EC9ED6D